MECQITPKMTGLGAESAVDGLAKRITHSPLADGVDRSTAAEEGVHDLFIPLCSDTVSQNLFNAPIGHCFPIRARVAHRIIAVGDCKDPRQKRNVFASQAVGIT